MKQLFKEIHCRVFHGHIMVAVGRMSGSKVMYMCARCIRCEVLEMITGKEFE